MGCQFTGATHMRYDQFDVDYGFGAGMDRFSNEYPLAPIKDIADFVLQDGKTVFLDVVASWPDPCEPRFVRLAAEMHALAAAVRRYQREADLTHDDTRCAMGFHSWFLNSFKHP